MEIPEEDLVQATYEAIYWWNRDEQYYHNYFSKLDILQKNEKLMAFFTTKIFDTFLKEYSVRRNIPKGYASVDKFLNEIITKHNFVQEVQKSKIEIIDSTSFNLIESNSCNNQTKSLLSKIAFLINPNSFSLCDTLTKNSLYRLSTNNIKREDFSSYTKFKLEIDTLRNKIIDRKLFPLSYDVLNKFEGSSAFIYFNSNPDAFELRVIDKLLWILDQSEDNRHVENEQYLELLKLNTQS